MPKKADACYEAIIKRRGEPSVPRSRTPILVSDEKSFTLKKYSPKEELPCILWAEECAATERLVDIVQERIEGALKEHGPIQIYFWAGTYDVIKGAEKEIELRYQDDQEKSLQVVSDQLQRLLNIVRTYPEVKVRFVDLPFIILKKTNITVDQQSLAAAECANNQLKSINMLVRQLNSECAKYTMMLNFSHDCIRSRKEKGKKQRHSFDPKSMEDGVLPSRQTSLRWVRRLQIDIHKTCYGCPHDPDVVVQPEPDDIAGQQNDIEGQSYDIAGQSDDIAHQPDDIADQPDDIADQPDDIAGQSDDIMDQLTDVIGTLDDMIDDHRASKEDQRPGKADNRAGKEDERPGKEDNRAVKEDQSPGIEDHVLGKNDSLVHQTLKTDEKYDPAIPTSEEMESEVK